MQANPTNAATYAALIAARQNVPADVMTYVKEAVSVANDRTAFFEAVIQAKFMFFENSDRTEFHTIDEILEDAQCRIAKQNGLSLDRVKLEVRFVA